ncbi:MAG: hypothetical protein ACRDOO_14015 [Actinomadura sp.]
MGWSWYPIVGALAEPVVGDAGAPTHRPAGRRRPDVRRYGDPPTPCHRALSGVQGKVPGQEGVRLGVPPAEPYAPGRDASRH